MNPCVLEVRDLSVDIRSDAGTTHILKGVDFTIGHGEIVGVVGESGCGKTTLVKTVLGILPANSSARGDVMFEGRSLLGLSDAELNRSVRGKRIGFVPQDPFLALNPVFTIADQLLEVMRWHTPGSPGDHRRQLVNMFGRVRIANPGEALERYPHQFSGGQRQRLLIAVALACRPSLLIADEPTTALDVTTQSDILDLLRELVTDIGISMLFVTHDFGVVAQLCDRVCVMWRGRSVEIGSTEQVLSEPSHPYTRALIACHPDRADGFTTIDEIDGALRSEVGY